jgi:homoserine dehydrogenase
MTAPLRIGIAGLGTVGSALVATIAAKRDLLAERCGRPLVVAAVAARDKGRDRGVDLSAARWFADPVALAADPGIDCFVELVGGAGDPALGAVKAALASGKHVVTANKALLARHGGELAALAEGKGLILNFEAAVAGGIPVIKTLREALTGNRIGRVFGILNGTCNYILTRMEQEGLSYEECLREAQRLGYAEADPAFDVDGRDTAHKLVILTSLAFGTQLAPDDVHVEGIEQITQADIHAADDLGYRIKLLGVAQRTETGVEQRVHPTLVPSDSQIAQVHGVTNAVAIDGDIVGQLVLSGPGAGGKATASAVLGDIADIAKARPGRQIAPAFGVPAAHLEPYRQAQMRAHEGGYFIRLTVNDRTGVFAAIATRMAEQNISLESIVQHRPRSAQAAAAYNGAQPVILVTHTTTEQAVRAAVEAIARDGHLVSPPQTIRIEK